jgi:hypothetical protein
MNTPSSDDHDSHRQELSVNRPVPGTTRFVEAVEKTSDATAAAVRISFFMAILTCASLVTSIAQCRFNGAQVEEMKIASELTRKSIELGQKTAHIDQRAWIGIKLMNLESFEIGKPVSVTIQLDNSGKTFANKVFAPYFIVVSTRKFGNALELLEERKRANISGEISSFSSISPNTVFRFSIKTWEPLSKNVLDEIEAGRAMIYVIGEIYYEDIFGEEHFTKYFAHYDPVSKSMPFYNDKDYSVAN